MNTDQIILEKFITHHAIDAVQILEQLDVEEITLFLLEIPSNLAAIILSEMETYTAVKCLVMLDVEKSVAIIEKLPMSVISVYLRQIDITLQEMILSLLPEEISRSLRSMLRYPEESAAALVDPFVLTLPDDISVKETLKRVRKRSENITNHIYVVNRSRQLSGIISLAELILHSPGKRLSEIMNVEIPRIPADHIYQVILNHPGWQNYPALPVVENNNIFLGAIRYETIRRIEREYKKDILPRHLSITSNALGELFHIGLSGLIRSATTPLKNRLVDK